jgi:hypothetical protein
MATTTFTATVMASSADEASAKVAKRLPEGFALTGRTGVRSAKHLLLTVEVENLGGNVDACWVILTSYGISPSKALGSHWETTLGEAA